MRTCQDSPTGQMLLGIRQFNNQEWFECHETLEDLWIGEEGEVRDFYQGIIQIAIALHHWRNGNYNGALILLESGAKYLRRVSAVCQWVDVAALISKADGLREELFRLGSEHMDEISLDLIPRIETVAV